MRTSSDLQNGEREQSNEGTEIQQLDSDYATYPMKVAICLVQTQSPLILWHLWSCICDRHGSEDDRIDNDEECRDGDDRELEGGREPIMQSHSVLVSWRSKGKVEYARLRDCWGYTMTSRQKQDQRPDESVCRVAFTCTRLASLLSGRHGHLRALGECSRTPAVNTLIHCRSSTKQEVWPTSETSVVRTGNCCCTARLH